MDGIDEGRARDTCTDHGRRIRGRRLRDEMEHGPERRPPAPGVPPRDEEPLGPLADTILELDDAQAARASWAPGPLACTPRSVPSAPRVPRRRPYPDGGRRT